MTTLLHTSLAWAAFLLAAARPACQAHAADNSFQWTGQGVGGALSLTYGAATDDRYTDAQQVGGAYLDPTLGIVDAAIGALVPITRDAPGRAQLLESQDFSRFFVQPGWPHGAQSFDRLFYPDVSSQAATDYPFHGGLRDIDGLLFKLDGGRVVNLISNVELDGGVDSDVAATPVPVPNTVLLLGAGLLAGLTIRRCTRSL